MALSKEIDFGDGVPLAYHRVATVTADVNRSTSVWVVSYPSQAKRKEEKAALAEGDGMNVYMASHCYELPWTDGMTASEAYAELKQQPEFEGAADVWDEGQVGA